MIHLCLIAVPHKGMAQMFNIAEEVKYDTNYITVYKDELTTRLFLARKQNHFNLSERLLHPWVKYKTNDNLLLGLGYTYSFLTLNLAVKMPFINGDDDVYGETKYLDIQTHAIFSNWIIDLYLQWNRGFYLANPEDVLEIPAPDPQRPLRGDMRSNLIGMNLQYLFNSERYSYKASFFQNEFQKKSAGSPILGIETYWMLALTDSATVAPNIQPAGFLSNRPFSQSDIFNAGLNAGYAYTFVWKQSLYFSLSSTLGISGGYKRIHDSASSETLRAGLSMGFTNSTRISLGYNNPNYYVGLSFISFSMNNRVGADGEYIGYRTGSIRFNIVKRFITKRPIRILRPDLWTF